MNTDRRMPASLDTQLAVLSREVAPARDLWPSIRAAMGTTASAAPKPSRRWPLAFAAGVSVATAAGLIGWQAMRPPRPSIEQATPASAGRNVLGAGFAIPEGNDYLATRVSLEKTYRERLGLLKPTTRRRVEADLAVIRAANADIRDALVADPQSPVLNRLLQGIWQQEFDLYVSVARNTDLALIRTRS